MAGSAPSLFRFSQQQRILRIGSSSRLCFWGPWPVSAERHFRSLREFKSKTRTAAERGVANALYANTVGSIFGAWFAGFVLIPTIGAARTAAALAGA